jgi:hypothetical protein
MAEAWERKKKEKRKDKAGIQNPERAKKLDSRAEHGWLYLQTLRTTIAHVHGVLGEAIGRVDDLRVQSVRLESCRKSVDGWTVHGFRGIDDVLHGRKIEGFPGCWCLVRVGVRMRVRVRLRVRVRVG